MSGPVFVGSLPDGDYEYMCESCVGEFKAKYELTPRFCPFCGEKVEEELREPREAKP